MLFKFFKKKAASVFISDSAQCTCQYFYTLASRIKLGRTIQLKDTQGDETDALLKVIQGEKNLVIFAHGDKSRLRCFYKRLVDQSEKDVYIEDGWWHYFKKKERIVYFHVCGGAMILRKRELKTLLSSWVSYVDEVYGVESSHTRIIELNKKLLGNIFKEVGKRKSPRALKSAVEGVYKSIESDVYDEETRSEPHDGFTHLIAMAGNNVKILRSSED